MTRYYYYSPEAAQETFFCSSQGGARKKMSCLAALLNDKAFVYNLVTEEDCVGPTGCAG